MEIVKGIWGDLDKVLLVFVIVFYLEIVGVDFIENNLKVENL